MGHVCSFLFSKNLEKNSSTYWQLTLTVKFLQNFHSNEVDRRSLSFSDVFSKFPVKYFVK